MVRVVQTERPWPDAGWPSRFEWLHGLGLFAAVSLAVTLARLYGPCGQLGSPSANRAYVEPTQT